MPLEGFQEPLSLCFPPNVLPLEAAVRSFSEPAVTTPDGQRSLLRKTLLGQWSRIFRFPSPRKQAGGLTGIVVVRLGYVAKSEPSADAVGCHS